MVDKSWMVKDEARTGVAIWLAVIALLVVSMVMLGGYTRLSGSGLSITEWKPIHGVIPPLNEAEWVEEFDAYKQIPQYSQINPDMELDGFKQIFWPEFLHRLLGRLVGAAFLLPMLWFGLRRKISGGFTLRLGGIFALGGLQGLMGWYMVSSGLSENTHVSHLRLAAHLSLAFLIFALLLNMFLRVTGLRQKMAMEVTPLMNTLFTLFFALLCLQVVYGAFVAGLHAGLMYNTFPTMNGHWVPRGMGELQPLWLNPLENVAAVQFIHRWLAKLLVVFYVSWWFTFRHVYGIKTPATMLANAVLLALLVQVGLGIATLLEVVPLPLALVHQLVALVVFGLACALKLTLKPAANKELTAHAS